MRLGPGTYLVCPSNTASWLPMCPVHGSLRRRVVTANIAHSAQTGSWTPGFWFHSFPRCVREKIGCVSDREVRA
eukprot:673583-Rhodomonas_salina.5